MGDRNAVPGLLREKDTALTFDEYMGSDKQYSKYLQMSSWHKFRHFLHDRRFFRGRGQSFWDVWMPLFVLNLTSNPKYWQLGFEPHQMDMRFCLGPVELIWTYE